MLVGVDFDNTVVCYDRVFHQVAVERGLIPAEVPATKGDVRDYLRRYDREDDWTELQGYVYGDRMLDASPFPGVLDFFAHCRQQSIHVCIISHKTRYPFRGPVYDLHQAAQAWLESRGFYDPIGTGLSPRQVFFELTKSEKLQRIAQVGCNYFIDDLPEFLAETEFPVDVERILFDPNHNYPAESRFRRATSWSEVKEVFTNGGRLLL
jgi:hypothetical protein